MFSKIGMWGAILTLAFLGACASTAPPKFVAPAMDPVSQARIERVSPLANLDVAGLTYEGQLPPEISALSRNVTNDLGEPKIIPIDQAVRDLGEGNARRHVVLNAKFCGGIIVQRARITHLRTVSTSVEDFMGKVREQQSVTNGVAFGGFAGGTLASLRFGPEYALMYAIGSALPGAANQYGYMLNQELSQMQGEAWLAQSRTWYDMSDLWLNAMDSWCLTYLDYVSTHGRFVRAPVPTSAPAPVRQGAAGSF